MRKALPLFLLVFASAPIGTAGDVLPVKPESSVIARLPKQTDALVTLGLADLFKETETVTTPSGMMIAVPVPDVLIARIGADGKIERVCVNSPEAVRVFAARTQAVPSSTPQDK